MPGSRATPAEIAEWMRDVVMAEGELYQVDAVAGIEERYGSDFTYTNDRAAAMGLALG